MRRLVAALCIAPLLITACQPDTPGDADGAPVLSYKNAYIIVPPGGRDVSVGGIEIGLKGGGVTLTGVTSDVAETVETHTMSMEDGTMKMRPVERFEIADGGTLTLERGGDHLMFFGVDQDLEPGDMASVTFSFETASGEALTLEAEAEIRALGQ